MSCHVSIVYIHETKKKLVDPYSCLFVITLHAGYFFMLFCRQLTFFQNYPFRNTIRVSNGFLDSDQNRLSLGPDLDANCFQRLSADDKSQR